VLSSSVNDIARSYSLLATVRGVSTPACFGLTNTVLPATLSLTADPGPLPPAGTTTLTAQVSNNGALTPTGSVDFLVDRVSVCTAVALDASGVAACVAGPFAAGQHNATANYSGDAARATAVTSRAIVLIVAGAAVSAVPLPIDSRWSMLLLIVGLALVARLREVSLTRR
jgi:hypothetical protein